MCLWSDQTELTYTSRRLDAGGLLSLGDWLRVLGELHDAGVRRLVVSGGGEPLINPDLPAILEKAADLFDVHLYTTGFSLRPGTRLFEALARCRRVRFSVHSPDPDTYDRICGTRPGQRALDRVAGNLAALLRERDAGTSIGIGMVILAENHHQIQAMATFADTVGVDWLDLRKDEVEVTAGLDADAVDTVRRQLRTIRSTSYRTRIDIGDELVATANGMATDRARTSECTARWFRPAIGAYGHLTPCDLKAEPRFAATGHVLGNVKSTRLLPLIAASAHRRVADDCAQCMPSSRAGNAVVHKILTDLQDGVGLAEQPFVTG
jgi:MoaA/NifB/PqqE/SkfB family radical SAM enzyme